MTTLSMDFPNIDLAEEVRKLVHQVPEGKVTTYGKVAEALGDIVASRFVGKVMSENDDIVRVPCRRVVQSDGTIGGFTGGGPKAKKKALRAEGISFDGDKILDFEKRLFTDFETKFPLRRFRQIQMRDSKKLVLKDDFEKSSPVAGADIAYSGDEAFGAMVLFEKGDPKPIKVVTIKTKASFPYIPTYLTFREAEIVSGMMKKLHEKPILVFDGNGIIHPLGFGIASHLGVMFDTPSIGVAKKLLCGSIVGTGQARRVMNGQKHLGFAISGRSWTSPVYVSPGHRISAASSLEILKPYWSHRLPEPVRIAHIEAEKIRRSAE